MKQNHLIQTRLRNLETKPLDLLGLNGAWKKWQIHILPKFVVQFMVMNTMGSNPYKNHQQVNNCKSISFTFLFFFSLPNPPWDLQKQSPPPHPPTVAKKTKLSWWLNQPIWKICSSNWVHLPQIGMNIKNIWVATTWSTTCQARQLQKG